MQHSEFYTLENYDNVSISCLSSKKDYPFVLFGYPENNMTLLQTKYNNKLFPCALFIENEIGFGKENSLCKSVNDNLCVFVIAQNELDSSTTYVYEYKSNDETYNFSGKNIRSKISNVNQTVTNSLSTCSDNEGNTYCIVFGHDLLSDKGGCILHTKKHDSEKWESKDLTEKFGTDKLVGFNSCLKNINGKMMLFTLNKTTNVISVFDFNNMEKVFEKQYFNIINIDTDEYFVLVCKNDNIELLSITNFDSAFAFEVNNVRNAKLMNNQIIVTFENNSVSIYDFDGTLKNTINEQYDFTTGIFYDNVDNLNICLLKNTQRSHLMDIKKLKIHDINKCDLDKTSLNVKYIGDDTTTIINASQRANILKYLFDEYFDTLDSNTFASYRCFFLKIFLDEKHTFLDPINTSKMYFNNTKCDNLCKYEDINKLKLYARDMCVLGYVNLENDVPMKLSNGNKYICFRYNGENFFPNGKMEIFDETNIETIDLILESRVINVTSLNYASIANLTMKDIVKTHFFTHKKDEDDETKYVIWKTLDGKKLDFPLFGLKDIFYNGTNNKIQIKLQVTSILEDFYYDIKPLSLNGDYIGNNTNEIILYQFQTELINNSIEDTQKMCKMNCNGI